MQKTPRTNIFRTVELLLAATFKTRQDGPCHKFLFGPPHIPHAVHRTGIQLCFTRLGLLETARHVRSCGPAYLRSLSIHELEGKLTAFLSANYWILAEETWIQKFDCSFANQVSDQSKGKLADVLSTSEIFMPRTATTLFPLVPIRIVDGFSCSSFFLIQPSSLRPEHVGGDIHSSLLIPEQFPPIRDWKGVTEHPKAWLGVRSPTLSQSKKLRSAVLGAVSLLPHPRERYLFTGRKVFGGHITFVDRWSFSPGKSHTPPLSEDIAITAVDHPWLEMLAAQVESTEPEARRQVKALEYFYRAWSFSEVERFPVLFMALDAVFGDSSKATQSVVDAVLPVMGAAYDEPRVKLLMGLRAAVIHGGAPDVYDSSKYFDYYRKYVQDPIYDLEVIAACCLRAEIFKGALVSRPHTYADILKSEFEVEE